MAFLAVTGESHSREAVAALLWPDYDERRAHAALRRTLSALNKALEGVGLQIGREAVSPAPDELWMDVAEFHRLAGPHLAHGHPPKEVCDACLPPLAEAAALYRGDFLAGFTLRDSPNFDEWQFFQTESLRRELAGVLERLVIGHSARAGFETAVAYARRWLALDPLHEPAHRQLIQLYAWTHQRAAALRQFQECARVLSQELGVSPLEETVQLAEAVREHRLPSPAAVEPAAPEPAAPRSPRPPAPPLVGRTAEWTALLHGYEAVRQDGRIIVLEGEAGIGKTRLAEAFLEWARTRQAATVLTRCYEGETSLAYGPFVEALRAAVQLARPGSGPADALHDVPDQWLSEAMRLLPELAALRPNLPAPPPLDGPGAQSRFFEGVSRLLLRLLAGRHGAAGVLFVDDLHWADEASLDLLTYLVRRLRGRPICILAAWRGEEVPAHHRLRQLLLDAGRYGLAAHIPLSRLNQEAVNELVRRAPEWGVEAPGQGAPAYLTERLYRESEGLPFFVIEYLAVLAQQKNDHAPGRWTSAEWTLPAGVRDLLESRLGAASETGRQLLSAAAAIGRSFDFETLQAASGRSEEETVAGLEALIAHGLVREVSGEESAGQLAYDFSHEKLRALVYEETSLARRRLLHQRIADALAQRARWRRSLAAGAGQVAEHYRLGGREAEAARFFTLAGEHARALYANAEALAHFQSALALGPQAEIDTAALHEAVGDLLTLAGDYAAALAAYAAAAARRPP
jgi:DNA-binding SARP family transcriptional activator